MNHGVADRLVIFLAGSLVVLGSASGCGDSATAPPASTLDPSRPTTVMVNPATAELAALGATVQLTAEVRDQNNRVMAGAAVTWRSGDTSVATVNASGLVTGVAEGVATITASAGSGQGTAEITVMDLDRAALVAFYEATDGPNWVNSENWLTDAPLAEWYGVHTDTSGRVVRLDLSGKWDSEARRWGRHGLSGPVPAQLSHLTNLTELVLSRNSLTGPIPPELSDLAQLEQFLLDFNDLTGPIPPEFGNFTNLIALDFNANDLSGPIPSELGNLTNLRRLNLAQNDFTGPIPSELGDLSALTYLRFFHNHLTGPIPPELGNLTELVGFDVGGNDLTGPIPVEIGNLTSLERLGLYGNGLTGSIPSWLGSLASLEWLGLGDNDLSGPVPVEIGNLTNLRSLWLNGNNLEGSIPETFLELDRLEDFRLGGNAGLCVPGTTIFTTWFDRIERTDAGSYCNDSDTGVLESLFEVAGGPAWSNAEGWLGSPVLAGWHGVRADSLGRVTALDLSRNGLVGRLPTELGELAQLTELRIAENPDLSGRLPLSLDRLPLRTLHYAGTGLCAPADTSFRDWLGAIPSHDGTGVDCAPLNSDRDALVAFYEATDGPNWVNNENWLTDAPLGEWFGIETDASGRVIRLAMSYYDSRSDSWFSNYVSGPLPPEIGDLTALTHLQFNNNRLSGRIPPELGKLTNLIDLDFNNNDLSGPIPSELGKLINLMYLQLNHNDLSGPIPPEFGDLADLRRLWIQSNDLEGAIPESFLELSALEEIRFQRNADLCAPGTAEFSSWLDGIERITGPYCNESDMNVLDRLYQTSGGPNWTNSSGWLETPVLDEWHGVTANTFGRVVTLDLTSNGLTGDLPASLGKLAEMTALRVGSNALSGRVASSLVQLPLQEFHYANTELCVPMHASFQAWLSNIPSHEGTGVECAHLSDREILESLYDVTDGPNWSNSDNWLTDAPLEDWYGVNVDSQGSVTTLELSSNALRGPIPPELGSLTQLGRLNLGWNNLTGPIPPDLGSLASLRRLVLGGNDLTGPIPSALTSLTNMEGLYLGGNDLTGPIPSGLGNLTELEWLFLYGNGLTGRIPSALGNLTNLERLFLAENNLMGPIPSELGNLSDLVALVLDNNDLTGPVPPGLANMSSLRELSLGHNSGLSGSLPTRMTDLQLNKLVATGTDLCAPSDPDFQSWLETIHQRRISNCASAGESMAYLTQAVQSREYPVPLVAGEMALLRVFVTAAQTTAVGIPAVRTRFYLNGTESHVTEIPAKTTSIPVEVLEHSLSFSANAEIPGEVVSPGLEMVVEIDPDGTLDPGLGVANRIPETGRLAVEVRDMPLFDLTLIPFVWSETQDSSIVRLVEEMAASSENHELLEYTHTLLPIGDLAVTAHEPVMSSSNSAFDLLNQTDAIRVMEGGSGHYMGMMNPPATGAGGVARQAGRSSYAGPWADVIAHELGHNLSLRHAPCGGAGGPDLSFPYPDGSAGVWGYDFRDGGRLVRPSTPDLMSYCEPEWISDYHFTNALRFRLFDEGPPRMASPAAQEAKSVLLWGGMDAEGEPFLNPSFVVDAPPLLPNAAGEQRITGRSDTGNELFSFRFDMPEVADGGGSSSFAFVFPVESGWVGNLASITLSGPGGSATLDGDTDLPMTILIDRGTGQVRGILRDLPQADAAALAPQAGPDSLDVLFSRGIPDRAEWGR